jgi:hypothetical protein
MVTQNCLISEVTTRRYITIYIEGYMYGNDELLISVLLLFILNSFKFLLDAKVGSGHCSIRQKGNKVISHTLIRILT